MKIIITPNDLMDKGIWEKACELLGINVWAVNEGLMDSDEELYLTEGRANKLGLLCKII